MIWTKGMSNWQKAETLQEINDFFANTPLSLITEKPKQQELPPIPSLQRYSTQQQPKKTNYVLIAVILGAVFLIIGIVVYNIYKKARKEEVRKVEHEKIASIKRHIRNNIEDYFQITKSPYEVGFLGGISNLFITVQNKSEYSVDQIVVVVKYITVNGDVWDKSYVEFPGLTAGGSMTLKAPDATRWSSIKAELYIVKSSALNLCYSQEQVTADDSYDPYLCK